MARPIDKYRVRCKAPRTFEPVTFDDVVEVKDIEHNHAPIRVCKPERACDSVTKTTRSTR